MECRAFVRMKEVLNKRWGLTSLNTYFRREDERERRFRFCEVEG
jgi:hypothetical protein